MPIPIPVTSLDHLVLTVADVERSVAFYAGVLGMEPRRTAEGRVSLHFGAQKINLHPAAGTILPRAAHPAPGSADVCLLTDLDAAAVVSRLQAHGVAVVCGPVPRAVAAGAVQSVYCRDPDGNLVEIAAL
jgi:catechol 2,3-dioxygenase-like lactoylglutathione lyase family enzyme